MMSRNPFHYALTFTFFGGLFVVLGLMGCEIRKDPWSIQACNWSASPWWNHVGVGVALLVSGTFF
jgi:hypothetical protein